MIISFPLSTAFSLDDNNSLTLTDLPKELHEAPSITVFNNNVHVVWNTYHDEFNTKIYYKRSLDKGKNWDNATLLTPNSITAIYPEIGVYQDIIHVVWKDYKDDLPEIFYVKSIDNGNNWSIPRQLTFNSTRVTNIYDINIVVEKHNIYLTWKDYRSGSSEIFFKKSIDSGDTWFEDKRLTSDYTPSYAPSLAVKDNNLYITYDDWGTRADLCLLKSDNYGDVWTNKMYITDSSSEGDSRNSNLIIENNNLYLVYQDDKTGNSEIYFKKSIDNGINWIDDIKLTNNSENAVNPHICVFEKNIIVIWQNIENNILHIHYKTSLDDGKTWSENQPLVIDMDCYDIDIICEKDAIHLVWQNYHEASWSDICYMNNVNYTSIPSNETVPIIPDNKESPGFELNFFIIILTILVIFIRANKNNKNKR